MGKVSSTKKVDVPYPKIVYTIFAFEISKFLARTISCFEEIQIQIKIQENLWKWCVKPCFIHLVIYMYILYLVMYVQYLVMRYSIFWYVCSISCFVYFIIMWCIFEKKLDVYCISYDLLSLSYDAFPLSCDVYLKILWYIF